MKYLYTTIKNPPMSNLLIAEHWHIPITNYHQSDEEVRCHCAYVGVTHAVFSTHAIQLNVSLVVITIV